jgi:integrase
MASQHLTSRFCAAARPRVGADGKPERVSYGDDDPVGLELRVSAEGRKTWTFRYRTLDGRQRRLTLGLFVDGDDEPTQADREAVGGDAQVLTLKAARRRARQVRAEAEDGNDPAAEKQARKVTARAEPLKTFDDLADAYLTACEKGRWKPKRKQKRARTLRDETGILTRNVRPVIGKLRLEDVNKAAVRRVLDAMLDRGVGAQTNRTHAVIRQVLAYAVALERLEMNVAALIAPPAQEAPRTRVLSDDHLKTFWSTCEVMPEGVRLPPRKGQDEGDQLYVARPTRIALQLCALLLQRRQEVAGMRAAELDLANKVWTVPAERMKSGRPHLVPLTERAVELIREALKLAKQDADDEPDFVFPSPRLTDDPDAPRKPLTPDSVTRAMARLCKGLKLPLTSPHDLRRTGASAMASERLGIAPYIVSHVLGHSGDLGGAAAVTWRHYAQHDFMPEKRRALEAWEALLLEIVGERKPAIKVTSLSEARKRRA